jgi:hypothetical protein
MHLYGAPVREPLGIGWTCDCGQRDRDFLDVRTYHARLVLIADGLSNRIGMGNEELRRTFVNSKRSTALSGRIVVVVV